MFINGGLADAHLFRYLTVLQPLTIVHPEYTLGLWCQFCLDELLVLLEHVFFVTIILLAVIKGQDSPHAFLQFHPFQAVQALEAHAASGIGNQFFALGQDVCRHQVCHHITDSITGIFLVVQQNAGPSLQFLVVQAV